jgi:hypothetical protein
MLGVDLFRAAIGVGMPRSEIILLVVVAFSGCARTIWYRQGATEADYSRDSYDCERDARQSGYFGSGYAGLANMEGFFERCMGAHGYVRRRIDEDGNLAPERRKRSRAAQAAVDDQEALAEQRRVAVELRKQRAATNLTVDRCFDSDSERCQNGDGGVPNSGATPKFGRCTEADMRAMLKQQLSSSAIQSACFD